MITLHCSSNCLSSFHMHLQREGARLRCPSKADGSMRPLECACFSWSHGESNSGGLRRCWNLFTCGARLPSANRHTYVVQMQRLSRKLQPLSVQDRAMMALAARSNRLCMWPGTHLVVLQIQECDNIVAVQHLD